MKRKKQVRKPKFPTVAVVMSGKPSGRPDGDWASFVGAEREAVIAQAIKARARWEAKGYGPYEIVAGTLTERIVLPTNFKSVKLSATPVSSSQGKR